jgi:hypothetical protein
MFIISSQVYGILRSRRQAKGNLPKDWREVTVYRARQNSEFWVLIVEGILIVAVLALWVSLWVPALPTT